MILLVLAASLFSKFCRAKNSKLLVYQFEMIMRLVWLVQMEPPIVEHLLLLYIACLPNMVVMAPFDEAELMHMVATVAVVDDRQTQLLQVSMGNGIGAALPFNNKGTPPEGRIMLEGCRVAVLGYNSIVQQCLQAASMLKSRDISVTVADAKFCKPLDADLNKQLANEHEILITMEEGSIGGYGSDLLHYLSLTGILDGPLELRAMVLPHKIIFEEVRLSARHISATILSILGRPKEALQIK